MKKTLWRVRQAVWGADSPINLYFETKAEADKYYNDSDYIDKPAKVTMSADKASDALMATAYELDHYFGQ